MTRDGYTLHETTGTLELGWSPDPLTFSSRDRYPVSPSLQGRRGLSLLSGLSGKDLSPRLLRTSSSLYGGTGEIDWGRTCTPKTRHLPLDPSNERDGEDRSKDMKLYTVVLRFGPQESSTESSWTLVMLRLRSWGD